MKRLYPASTRTSFSTFALAVPPGRSKRFRPPVVRRKACAWGVAQAQVFIPCWYSYIYVNNIVYSIHISSTAALPTCAGLAFCREPVPAQNRKLEALWPLSLREDDSIRKSWIWSQELVSGCPLWKCVWRSNMTRGSLNLTLAYLNIYWKKTPFRLF